MKVFPLATAALTAALVIPASGCSLILDFEPIAYEDSTPPPIDATVLDDGYVVVEYDAGPDPYEPNDDTDTATPITPGTYTGLAINPAGDHDFFSFTLDATADVVIQIDGFVSIEGDLELRLRDAATNPIGASNTTANLERIPQTGAMQLGPGTFTIDVYSFNGSYTNTYSLTLTVGSST